MRQKEIETREHFMVTCPATESIRAEYICQFKQVVENYKGEIDFNTNEQLLKYLLDPSHI